MRTADPPLPRLAADEVHVWAVPLDLPPPRLGQLKGLLTADEAARAAGLLAAQDRDRFVAARGLLRLILGRYLGLPPAALRFGYAPAGKPYLLAPSPGPALSFNLSHAADLALIAVARGGPVGVDLEQLQPNPEADRIVAGLFAPQEVASYLSLPAPERPAAFLRGWTRKEAYLKARGEGLSVPLNQFAVTLAPGEPPRLLAHALGPAEVARWALYDLAVGAGFVAALALEQGARAVVCLRWPEPATSYS